MTTTYYYTDAFDITYVEWVEVGSRPYLDAIDYPTNYISTSIGTSKKEGIWDFPDSSVESAETLTKVELEIYSRGDEDPDLGRAVIRAYVWDGSSWTLFSFGADTDAWSWKTVDITSKINTWAKLDSCRVYLTCTTIGEQVNYADCMRLKATSTPEVAKKYFGDGLTFVTI